MKIEKINDNQIRCTLTAVDLNARKLDLSELAYGSQKTRSLFREMIELASQKFGFDPEDIPLVIEAVPMSSGSITLIITKVEDPEELDSRFSRFTPSPEDEQDLPQFSTEGLEGTDALEDLLSALRDRADVPISHGEGLEGTDNLSASTKPVREETVPTPAEKAKPETPKKPGKAPARAAIRFYSFRSLDAAISAAKACGSDFSGTSVLYKLPAGTFVLVLCTDDVKDAAFIHVCNRLSDFASQLRLPDETLAYYEEHYTAIIRKDALRHLAEI